VGAFLTRSLIACCAFANERKEGVDTGHPVQSKEVKEALKCSKKSLSHLDFVADFWTAFDELIILSIEYYENK